MKVAILMFGGKGVNMEHITLDISDLGLKVLNEQYQLIYFINYSRLIGIEAGYDYICFDSGNDGRFVVPMEDRKERQKWLDYFEAKGLGDLIEDFESHTLLIRENVMGEKIIFVDTGFYAVNEQGFTGKFFSYDEFETYERTSMNTVWLYSCDRMCQLPLCFEDEYDAKLVEEQICFKYIGEWED